MLVELGPGQGFGEGTCAGQLALRDQPGETQTPFGRMAVEAGNQKATPEGVAGPCHISDRHLSNWQPLYTFVVRQQDALAAHGQNNRLNS